jgi:NAD(P)-dependent dehydrogenase (short-subunit alcohol dehydrogenase family)
VELGLHGRTLVVTGGGSGFGRALVGAALEEGMRVAVLDREPADSDGDPVLSLVVDVTDAKAVDDAVAQVEDELGPISATVACAGVAPKGRAEDVSMDEWDLAIGVNLTGAFITAQAVGRRMLARGDGAIVLVGSSDSFGGHMERTAYVAAKHGVLGLARSLAIEWGPRGVRVNVLAPGPIDTPMLRRNNTEAQLATNFYDRLPLRRLSLPAEQANAALFLLSDAARFVTGASLSVDGGLTAGHLTSYA